MYRETLHTARHLQERRLTEATPRPRPTDRSGPRKAFGLLLVRVGQRLLAGSIDVPVGSRA